MYSWRLLAYLGTSREIVLAQSITQRPKPPQSHDEAESGVKPNLLAPEADQVPEAQTKKSSLRFLAYLGTLREIVLAPSTPHSAPPQQFHKSMLTDPYASTYSSPLTP